MKEKMFEGEQTSYARWTNIILKWDTEKLFSKPKWAQEMSGDKRNVEGTRWAFYRYRGLGVWTEEWREIR